MTELERLKERISVIDVLERVGAVLPWDAPKGFWGDDEAPFFCPFCDDAGSKKPAGRANTMKNLWHCWSCGRGGSVIDAAMYFLGPDANAARGVEWLLEQFPDEEVLSDPWAEAE